ncbi:unnamed protein product, partial [Ilex paraguariensis]
MDDEMGLTCNKEPPDKGFYYDNDITYHIELDSQDLESDLGTYSHVDIVNNPNHI